MINYDSVEFQIGEFVYLKSDIDQFHRIVTAITFRSSSYIMYELSLDVTTSWHLGLEISKEKDVLKQLN